MTDIAPVEAPAPDTPPPLEGKALVDQIASEMGWRDKDKFKGDPEKWQDSDAFLRATPAVLKSAKEASERSARAAAQTIERIQRQAIADAEAKIAAAAEAGDRDAAADATRELKEASRTVDPQVTDFAARNPWYMVNRAATNLAVETAEEVMQSGGSTAAQLAAAEKEVRKRFPELFGDNEPEPTARREAPAVAGGQRAASPAARKKGWSDMPKHVQDAQERHFVRKGLLTKEEAAESYWSENA